jgi:peptide/nickel transport system permease protein
VALYVLRRFGQALVTVFGVMVLTFLLFRVIAGDIAAAHLGEKATEKDKAEWRQQHGYRKPLLLNLHRQLVLADRTEGQFGLTVDDPEGTGSRLTDELSLAPAERDINTWRGRYVFGLDRSDPVETLLPEPPGSVGPEEVEDFTDEPAGMVVQLNDGRTFEVDLADVGTIGDLIERINKHPANVAADGEGPAVEAYVADIQWLEVLDTQFFDHLRKSVTFSAVSLVHHQELTEIIRRRAPKSLALTVPALAIGWMLGMIISSIVAYFRGTPIDTVVVFLSVLGMCVPVLAFMIYGQALVFEIDPDAAYGIQNPANIYIPVFIMVLAGLGRNVRFYRTVILDEVNRDYVRTARAKGAPLPRVLFIHVLRNCMLPILTSLVATLPLLIMGSLLFERQFGIPGLGGLMLSSIEARDEPVISGLVFLTALIWNVGILITDLSYALFDPRIRLH